MRTIAIIQSRMNSARLPSKAVAPIAGKPMLAHVLERALAIRGLAGVALATSVNERDDPIADLGLRTGCCLVYRGDEHDVLGRFKEAAAWTRAERVMRITGDCPLVCVDVCEAVLALADAEPWWPFVSNDTLISGYPDGVDVELFRMDALRDAHRLAMAHSDREHVTRWMRRHLVCQTVHAPGRWTHLKWSVDCAEDLARVRRIYGFLPAGAYTLADALAADAEAQVTAGVTP